jgi:hypothetical protein
MIVGRVRRRLVVLALASTALTACVGPSRTDDDYHRKAGNTAEAMRSAVESGRLVADLVLHDRAFGPYASIAASEAEQAAGGVQAAFDSVQPPSKAADEVRASLDPLLQEAAGALADLRIAVRRHLLADVRAAAADLAAVSAKLKPLVGV